LAELPCLPATLLKRLIERGLQATAAEASTAPVVASLIAASERHPELLAAGDVERLLASDACRAALGRIASTYDGGQLME
jgi:hypothetical protein